MSFFMQFMTFCAKLEKFRELKGSEAFDKIASYVVRLLKEKLAVFYVEQYLRMIRNSQ